MEQKGEETKNTTVNHITDDEDHPNGRCKYADPSGGIIMHDEANIATKVVKDLLSKIGKNFVSFNIGGLRGISTPAFVHSSKSYLDTAPFDCINFEHFIRKLVQEDADPIKKLQYIVAAKLANLNASVMGMGTRGPLNPILGETATYVTDSGMTLYSEQTCHHPAVSHFHLVGPPECPFEYYGHFEYHIVFYKTLTGLTFSQPGKQSLKLPDGTIYTITPFKAEVVGLMTTSKKFCPAGNMQFTDVVNGLTATVTFDVNEPKRRGYLGGWVGGGHGKLKEGEVSENREDLIAIDIAEGTDIKSKGSGSWLEKIVFGDDLIWDINMKGCKSHFKKPDKDSYLNLPSDSSRRPDGAFIDMQDWENAEAAKHELEELQRHDAKLRKEAAAKQ